MMIGIAIALTVAAAWLYFILDAWTDFIIWADKLFRRGGKLVNGTIPELLAGIMCYALGWICLGAVCALPLGIVYGIVRMLFS